MKVRITASRVGMGIDWWDGDIVDLPANEAERLIAANQAERLDDESKELEAAVTGPTETAALSHKPNFRKRGRKYVSPE